MAIVISCIAASLCLMGVLLVSHSTANTMQSMPPLHDPREPLTAFPADIEQQLAVQQPVLASAGLASLGTPIEGQDDQPVATADTTPEAASLRDAINQVATQTGGSSQDIKSAFAGLEKLLLSQPDNPGAGDDQSRAVALRELMGQDGTIVLPQFDLPGDLDDDAIVDKLGAQIDQLQDAINSQVRDLPELQGLQVTEKQIQLNDPAQLSAAVDALKQELDKLGLQLPPSAQYDALNNLGDTLLKGTGATLEGLDLNELQQVSGELLKEFGLDDVQDADTSPDAQD